MNSKVTLTALASLSFAFGIAANASGPDVAALLKIRLPKTDVSAVDCSKVKGLCEVTAGDNLFYVDESARYLVIGRVYDMETRQDLTAARLLELNPDLLLGGAARANAAANGRAEVEATELTRPGDRQAGAGPAKRVDLSRLSDRGAITWGRGGRRLTVFSDFRCGYCRALAKDLESVNVTVVERPISILGSRDVSEAVLCAPDRARAIKAAYAGEDIARSARCDTPGLDENEAFARANGFTGTPVIVREDGAVLEGYRPKAALLAWLNGGSK